MKCKLFKSYERHIFSLTVIFLPFQIDRQICVYTYLNPVNDLNNLKHLKNSVQEMTRKALTTLILAQ